MSGSLAPVIFISYTLKVENFIIQLLDEIDSDLERNGQAIMLDIERSTLFAFGLYAVQQYLMRNKLKTAAKKDNHSIQ